ncbi:trypsin-like peptidase domain-containing protein [Spongiactinospora sp. TRM90649]|uniref:S1C family serine protease n=1 Tax=Spongiactinospora sp. TRM90649 TaxID=3031114 RepID=UPI0023F7D6C3|nr:trypsin-like peptidase domain-containing protein [Spongiactinospora sp. TRM90649]MDF5757040.1 trypsin-like peptidase domain-containing protein [Spongiactinospora sp. TRM90649]
MSTNEPSEQGQERPGGWSQFGPVPPKAGEFPGKPVAKDPAQGQAQAEAREPGQEGARETQGQDATRTAAFASPAFLGGGPPPPAKTRTGFTGRQKALAGLALAAVAIGGGITGALAATAVGGERQVVATSPVLDAAADTGANTIAGVAAAVQPSVVSVEAGQGGGSGVILSADGLILTNDHVAELASSGDLRVKFNDGKSAKATVKGTDLTTDLAVLQAEGVSGLTAASLGNSDALKVGDSVLAIGSPLGLAGSVTAGIVSALNRTVTVNGEQQSPQEFPPGWGRERQQQRSPSAPTSIGGAIQTDAAINHGNSGGALVNARGQVVGINTAILTAGGDGNIGVGFAIPINTAKKVADELIAGRAVKHAQLGVSVQDATSGAAGALVGSVAEGSPAAKAGLRQGDVITKIDDRAIEGSDALVGAIRGFSPNQTVTITYQRDGQTQTARVTLAEKTE